MRGMVNLGSGLPLQVLVSLIFLKHQNRLLSLVKLQILRLSQRQKNLIKVLLLLKLLSLISLIIRMPALSKLKVTIALPVDLSVQEYLPA